MQQQIQQGLAQLQQLQQENAALRQALKTRMAETQVKAEANQIHAYDPPPEIEAFLRRQAAKARSVRR